MYINLLLGAVALVVLWLWLRKLVVRDDTLREDPAVMLEKEVARRKALENRAAAAFERLRDVGKERMRPVAAALDVMRAAVPVPEDGTPARRVLAWNDEGDTILVRVSEAGSGDVVAELSVAWRVPEVDLGPDAAPVDAAPGGYVLKRSGADTGEHADSLDACVGMITSFIVDYMP